MVPLSSPQSLGSGRLRPARLTWTVASSAAVGAQASGVSVWSGGGTWLGHQGRGQHRRGGRWGARGGVAGRALECQSTGRGWAVLGRLSEPRAPVWRWGWLCSLALSAGNLCQPSGGGRRQSPARSSSSRMPAPKQARVLGGGCKNTDVPLSLDRKQLLLPAHPEGLGGVFLAHYTDYYSISEVTQWGLQDSSPKGLESIDH